MGQALGEGTGMSNPGPPKILEKLVGALLPPAYREHVLGDLWERYRGNWRYLCEALLILPLLVVSRIRRTTDAQNLLTEAFAVYLSFVAAGWQFYGSSFLYDHSGFLRLAVPAGAALGSLLLLDAYFDRGYKGLTVAVRGVAFAVGISLSPQFLMASLIPRLRLPLSVLLAGGASSVLLVSGLRRFLQAGALHRFQQSLECRFDPHRMSAEEIRTAAFRIRTRARVVRVVLCLAGGSAALVWVWAMRHSPNLAYSLGCGISLAGTAYGVYVLQKGFSRGRLEADASLAMCLEFYRRNLEGRLDLLRHVWPRLIALPLAGTLIVLAADPAIPAFWLRVPGVVLAILFYGSLGWLVGRRAPAFQRQIDALDQFE
jgi:hypothetical protein